MESEFFCIFICISLLYYFYLPSSPEILSSTWSGLLENLSTEFLIRFKEFNFQSFNFFLVFYILIEFFFHVLYCLISSSSWFVSHWIYFTVCILFHSFSFSEFSLNSFYFYSISLTCFCTCSFISLISFFWAQKLRVHYLSLSIRSFVWLLTLQGVILPGFSYILCLYFEICVSIEIYQLFGGF
jgi:hypothetical protein